MLGGDIIEITFNHPTLGSGTIYPKAGEDSTYDLGGLRSADEDSGVAGNGETIDTMNRKRWFFEVVCGWDMNIADEMTILNSLAADPNPSDWTFTHINGTIWGGSGKPVGDLQGNGNAATFTLKVSGGGKLSKIA